MAFEVDERSTGRDRIIVYALDGAGHIEGLVASVAYELARRELDWWMRDRTGDYAAPIRVEWVAVASRLGDDEHALACVRRAVENLRRSVEEDLERMAPDPALRGR